MSSFGTRPVIAISCGTPSTSKRPSSKVPISTGQSMSSS